MTTYNQVHYTVKAIRSLKAVDEKFDLVVFDDFSSDRTVPCLMDLGITVVSSDRPRGLTNSWNLAYKMFLDSRYDALIIANNDILVPRGALGELYNLLGSSQVVVPMTTQLGCGHNADQSIRIHHPYISESVVNQPEQYQRVQDSIRRANPISMKKFNGFFFLMGRNIVKSEYRPGVLFNPLMLNVGNEDDLNARLKVRPVLCRTSFLFHFKGVSFFPAISKDKSAKQGRNNLSRVRS
jgi:GT2 family glycosyltransferase